MLLRKPTTKPQVLPNPVPLENYSGSIFTSFIDQVVDYAIFLLDKQGQILTWNKGAENIKGYTANEIIGKHISVFYTQNDIEKQIPESNLAKASLCGRYEDEGWRVRKDGSLFWANIIFTALYDAGGAINGFSKITRDITIRKRQEDESASLAALIKHTSDAVFSTTPMLEILTWNRSAEQLYGYTAEEVVGKTTLLTIKPQISAEFLQERSRIIAQAGHWTGEIVHIHKNGYPVTVSASVSAIRKENGEVNRYIFIVRDISAQKLAEEKICYLANIVEQTFDAVFSYNADYTVLSWNHAAEQVYGYPATEAIGTNVLQLLQPQLDEDARLSIRAFIAEKGYWTGEVMHQRKNGTLLHVNISLTVIRNREGNIAEYICICRDVTERKIAEETERKLKAQLNKLLQNKLDSTLKELTDYKHALDTSSIVAITNQKGIIEFVNNNFCKISGYTKEELVGRDHRIINSGYHDALFIKNLWITIASGLVWKGEIKNRAKNGCYYWVDTTIIPFLNEKGKPYQYVAIRADITERKKAEEELNALNEQLEQRIKTRTSQLMVANKELEAFSYSVSHDLRAPLRSINSYARILSEEYRQLLDKEGERLLEKITRNAANMGRLIDDLLDFTRLGKIEAAKLVVDMQQLVNSCIGDLQQNGNPLKVIFDISPLPACKADGAMLKQVWQNLLSNAVKYSAKKPQPVVQVSATENDETIVYSVKDNGDGFDMQYYHQLFGVFQRLHDNSQFEGTGVGLAIVKLIINKHKGEVWAESAPGQGATFYFSLPKNKI